MKKKYFVIMFIEELEDGFGEFSFKTPKATFTVDAFTEEEAIEKAKASLADIIFSTEKDRFKEYQDAEDYVDWLEFRFGEVEPGCNLIF